MPHQHGEFTPDYAAFAQAAVLDFFLTDFGGLSLIQKSFAACLACFLYFGTAHAAIQKQTTVVVISLDGFPAYALDDPRLPIPTLRKLAREGAAAAAMQPTVTWPNHTTMVTGVNASHHQVLFNGLLSRATQPMDP